MKKTLIFIAIAMLFCTVTKAQELAFTLNSDNSFQTSLLEQPQTSLNSIYSLPMPTTDFATGNQFNTQQFASQKGWGIACVISGGVIMSAGLFLWLGGGIFTKVSDQAATMEGYPDAASMEGFAQDPEAAASMEGFGQDPTAKKVNDVGKGLKTAGIIGTAAGAVLVGTGIVLLTSNSGGGGGGYSRSKSNKPHRTKKRKGHARSNPRHAELMPDYSDMQPDWSLCLNVGPTSAGLTFAF